MEDYVDALPKVNELNRKLYLALSRTYLFELKSRTPVKTSETAGEWELHTVGPLQFEFINERGDIVAALEYGTKEHIIKAKNKEFLRFKVPVKRKSTYKKILGNQAFEKDGYVFAKMVRHPGFMARLFIHEIMYDEGIEKRFQNELEALLVT